MWAASIPARSAEVGLRTARGFSDDRCGIAAAGITYFALISIFPLALVALSVAGFVFTSEADQARLLDTIIDNLPLDEEGGRDDLEEVIRSIVAARGTLGIFGIVSGLYTGSALFTAVRVALNGVFHVEKPRPFIAGKLVDIAMVIVFGLLLALSTGASFAVAFIGRLADELSGGNFTGAAQLGVAAGSLVIAFLISTGLFLLLYVRIPSANVRWKHALPGALLAALLFEVLKAGFAQYASNFGNYNATYGSLGFVLLLLAFIYFSAQIVLLGAEAARASGEVAMGWPFAPADSHLHNTREKVRAAMAKVRSLFRRGAPVPGTPETTMSAAAGQSPPTRSSSGRAALPGNGVDANESPENPEAPHSAPTRGAWLATCVVLAGFAVAAFASALRSRR